MSLILGACAEKLINKEKIFVGAKPEELIVIVDYFDKFPLISQKWADFYLFKEVFPGSLGNRRGLVLADLLW